MRRFALTFAAVMNLLLVDQVVKAVSVSMFKNRPPLEVIPNLFNLAYVENRGCAWGMFQGQVWPLVAFAVVAFLFVLWKRKDIFPAGAWGNVAECALYAGILGNLVDRVWLGYVIDMFDWHWGIHHFPCFNPADVYINVAAYILIGASLFRRSHARA